MHCIRSDDRCPGTGGDRTVHRRGCARHGGGADHRLDGYRLGNGDPPPDDDHHRGQVHLGAVINSTRALTAGHCGKKGEDLFNTNGDKIGTITTNLISRHADIAVVTLLPGQRVKVDRIDWGAKVKQGEPVKVRRHHRVVPRRCRDPEAATDPGCGVPLPGPLTIACAFAPPSPAGEPVDACRRGDVPLGGRRQWRGHPSQRRPDRRHPLSKALAATDSENREVTRSFYTPVSLVPKSLR